MVPSQQLGTKSMRELTSPKAVMMLFLPCMESPLSSCPSTQRFTGSFRRAASGSWDSAHSCRQRTRKLFSAGEQNTTPRSTLQYYGLANTPPKAALPCQHQHQEDKKCFTSRSRFEDEVHHLGPVVLQDGPGSRHKTTACSVSSSSH